MRLPSSRPSSPSRLRSLPSVGVSAIEALSDNAATLINNGNADQEEQSVPQQLDDDNEDWGRDKEVVLPVSVVVMLTTIKSEADAIPAIMLMLVLHDSPRDQLQRASLLKNVSYKLVYQIIHSFLKKRVVCWVEESSVRFSWPGSMVSRWVTRITFQPPDN